MGENIKGYENSESIRLWTGSPGQTFGFSKRMDTVMIDNLGSPSVYVSLNGGVPNAGSSNLIVGANSFRTFDVRTGSIGVSSTTTGSVQVQVIGGNSL